ncbi:hypothetical protein KSP39_PZI001110 [Platanthera zijinensis]|uniref:Tf2-1-like SH3-like domain-containing protein n=1 Tax=Platanthera zijinensis TaxID=2320716 RepID=A0AAP0GF22_9ASPA
MHGVTRVRGQRKKLSPRYMGPYRIQERIGPLAYRLELPPELASLHDVFYISSLRRDLLRPEQQVTTTDGPIASDRLVHLEPVRIDDKGVRVLRHKKVPLVKVLWRNHGREEHTREPQDLMRQRYPELFSQPISARYEPTTSLRTSRGVENVCWSRGIGGESRIWEVAAGARSETANRCRNRRQGLEQVCFASSLPVLAF